VKSLKPTSGTPKVSGTVVIDQIDISREELGADVVARAKATLPQELQRVFEDVLPISWIEAATFMELKNAIAREVGRDPIEFQKWVVKTAIGRTVGKFWRALLARVWDSAIVKRAPIIYSKTFDVGEATVISFENGRAELVVTGWPDMPEYDAVGLATGMEALLEYSGRHGAHVKFARKGEKMSFSLSWRPTS
jgi:hypothetical protein